MSCYWLLFLLFLVPISVLASEEYDEYQYDDPGDHPEDIKVPEGGDRLVGARAGDSNKLPFVVSYNFLELFYGYSLCTGSLITRSYFLSAVHCTIFPTQQIEKGCGPTPKYILNNGQRQKMSCKRLPNKDMMITTYDPPSMVWLGVNNIAKDMKTGRATNIRVSYIIQPRGAYRTPGSYGDYGGYDIILGRLESPAPIKYTPACVPSLAYRDVGKSSLAGYGMYTRNKCITNSYGPSKSHYCSTRLDLEGNSFMKKDKEGTIFFFDGVKNVTGSCSQRPTPTNYDRVCSNFLKNSGYKFKDHTNSEKNSGRDGVDEVHLLQVSAGSKVTWVKTCYRDTPGEHGWCQTSGDFTNIKEEGLRVENTLYNSKDWGFCTRECKLKGNGDPQHGVLRAEEHVDVLEEKECDSFLNISLNYVDVPFRPQILCVGEKLPYSPEYFWTTETDPGRAKQWRKLSDEFIIKNKAGLRKLNYKPEYRGDVHDWFIESAGTCKGDSGGPMFQKIHNTFILTGAVSGGRGQIGNCGGINNPTHYVRVKMFHKWIKTYAGKEEDWCEAGNSGVEEGNVDYGDWNQYYNY